MDPDSSITPFGHRLIAMMSQAMNPRRGARLAPITHRIPVEHEPGQLPAIYTIDLEPAAQGGFYVTCREVPELTTCSADERQGLERGGLIIRSALRGIQSAPHSRP